MPLSLTYPVQKAFVLLLAVFILGTLTAAGISPRPFLVLLGDLKLRIPKSYEFPRGAPDTTITDVKMKEIGVVFWMPDLAPPESNAYFTTTFRPAELLRPNAGLTEHLVIVRSFGRTADRAERRRLPVEEQIINVKRYLQYFTFVPDKGLQRVEPQGFRKLPMTMWLELSDPTAPILLECVPEAPNPSCSVQLHLRELDITAALEIPADARYNVRNVANSFRQLLQKWTEH